MSFGASLRRAFGHDAVDWFNAPYFVDWGVVILTWILSWIISETPVFERGFSPQDPLIGHPHRGNTVGSMLNHWVALLVPAGVIAISGMFRKSLLMIHHGVISVCAARGLARLITVFMKHTVGRLRPDFLSRCKWDSVLKACTGNPSDIVNGRTSFPSGHSSTAFSGMTVLSLWLAGQTAAWCFNAPCSSLPVRSRLASFFLTLLPLSWAAFVAISRVEDNKHHVEDVVVGSMIGFISSLICYHIFWPSPFSASSFKQHVLGLPRLLYSPEGWDDDRQAPFELARMDGENIDV
ncbi:lipid phosphate phosphatase 1 [Amanita rubescens]|nr:lipid phosphate phosphatase 1 [Amanita rubescens]